MYIYVLNIEFEWSKGTNNVYDLINGCFDPPRIELWGM